MPLTPILEIRDLAKSYRLPGKTGTRAAHLKAVDGVSLQIARGETLGLVGESGCGKSTLGKLVLRLTPIDRGEVLYRGTDLAQLSARQMRPYRRQIQMIFQDPFSSLNPRMTIGETLTEPLIIHKLCKAAAREGRIRQLLDQVGLDAKAAQRYPHEFSGGQRQRISIARALAVEPELIIADEPVSALDLSVQAQILNLLREIQQAHNLSFLFIAHDLSVVEHVSDRVAVMYLGKIVEVAPAEELYRHPRHPYTEALLRSIPQPDPSRKNCVAPLKGELPSHLNPPTGCTFHPRCPYASDLCRQQSPALLDNGISSQVACHHSDRVGLV
ncbi:ABC transporter ATP-binding protein [Geopsychrobacter electrodiphilus]|uniref:ABC transporter ATP-binding protein n=1 Tax=Geopsychrobacter electrodiphilus TaxID=225196 RepID=UPI0003742843|nr:oligopeptide/dipeptide ABC transporter ATP-binding protein [Geopsychrobacter electrodiphilus]